MTATPPPFASARPEQSPDVVSSHTLADMLGYRGGLESLGRAIQQLAGLSAEMRLTLGLGSGGQWELLAAGTQEYHDLMLVPTPGPPWPWHQLHDPGRAGWVQACLGGDDAEPADLAAMGRRGRAMAAYLRRPVVGYHLGHQALLASEAGWRLVPVLGSSWLVGWGRD